MLLRTVFLVTCLIGSLLGRPADQSDHGIQRGAPKKDQNVAAKRSPVALFRLRDVTGSRGEAGEQRRAPGGGDEPVLRTLKKGRKETYSFHPAMSRSASAQAKKSSPFTSGRRSPDTELKKKEALFARDWTGSSWNGGYQQEKSWSTWEDDWSEKEEEKRGAHAPSALRTKSQVAKKTLRNMKSLAEQAAKTGRSTSTRELSRKSDHTSTSKKFVPSKRWSPSVMVKSASPGKRQPPTKKVTSIKARDNSRTDVGKSEGKRSFADYMGMGGGWGGDSGSTSGGLWDRRSQGKRSFADYMGMGGGWGGDSGSTSGGLWDRRSQGKRSFADYMGMGGGWGGDSGSTSGGLWDRRSQGKRSFADYMGMGGGWGGDSGSTSGGLWDRNAKEKRAFADYMGMGGGWGGDSGSTSGGLWDRNMKEKRAFADYMGMGGGWGGDSGSTSGGLWDRNAKEKRAFADYMGMGGGWGGDSGSTSGGLWDRNVREKRAFADYLGLGTGWGGGGGGGGGMGGGGLWTNNMGSQGWSDDDDDDDRFYYDTYEDAYDPYYSYYSYDEDEDEKRSTGGRKPNNKERGLAKGAGLEKQARGSQSDQWSNSRQLLAERELEKLKSQDKRTTAEGTKRQTGSVAARQPTVLRDVMAALRNRKSVQTRTQGAGADTKKEVGAAMLGEARRTKSRAKRAAYTWLGIGNFGGGGGFDSSNGNLWNNQYGSQGWTDDSTPSDYWYRDYYYDYYNSYDDSSSSDADDDNEDNENADEDDESDDDGDCYDVPKRALNRKKDAQNKRGHARSRSKNHHKEKRKHQAATETDQRSPEAGPETDQRSPEAGPETGTGTEAKSRKKRCARRQQSRDHSSS